MKILSVLLNLGVMVAAAAASAASAPSRLTTDMLEHTNRVFLDGHPSSVALEELKGTVERYQLVEIRNERPRFGWQMNSDRANTKQTAFRVLLATSLKNLTAGKADVWDSGKVETDNSVSVEYSGAPLKPSTIYYWKVKTWDNHGGESEFSPVKSFITAKKLDGVTARYPLQVSNEFPVKIKTLGDGTFFADFGKAAFGRLNLTLTSKEEKSITIRLGEHAKNGRIDRKPGGSIRYAEYALLLQPGTHTYALKIRKDKRNTNVRANESAVNPILMPDFTGEVLPFRYCEIENYPGALLSTQIQRQTVHYLFDETDSSFTSSNAVLNQVWDLCKYSVKAASFAGIFVDGDRERIPYEGDIIVGQLTRYAVDRHYEYTRFSDEYLFFAPTWPTEWSLQMVLLSWRDYLYSGNPNSLQKYYKELKAKTLSALTEKNGLISTRTGKVTKNFLKTIHFNGGNFRDIVDWPAKEADGFVFTKYNTVVNAYHYETLRLMSEISGVLGRSQEREQYAKDAERVRRQMNSLLFDSTTGIYCDGIETRHSSLHANIYPLAFGVVPEERKPQVLNFIRSRGLACSVYGAQALLDGVYDSGDADYGLKLLTSTDERSWYNMIRAGSTIAMEAWDNKYKPNQDWNHIWGTAAGNIIARKLMGVEPLEPGFRKIRIKPQPATLESAALTTPTVRGAVSVSFENQIGKKFSLVVEIPANSVAEVWLPKVAPKCELRVDSVATKGVEIGEFVKVEIGSGKHSFEVKAAP